MQICRAWIRITSDCFLECCKPEQQSTRDKERARRCPGLWLYAASVFHGGKRRPFPLLCHDGYHRVRAVRKNFSIKRRGCLADMSPQYWAPSIGGTYPFLRGEVCHSDFVCCFFGIINHFFFAYAKKVKLPRMILENHFETAPHFGGESGI